MWCTYRYGHMISFCCQKYCIYNQIECTGIWIDLQGTCKTHTCVQRGPVEDGADCSSMYVGCGWTFVDAEAGNEPPGRPALGKGFVDGLAKGLVGGLIVDGVASTCAIAVFSGTLRKASTISASVRPFFTKNSLFFSIGEPCTWAQYGVRLEFLESIIFCVI